MKGGIAIKMKGGKAVMLGLLALAVAIIIYGFLGRFQLVASGKGPMVRIDTFTGQACIYQGSEFSGCTPLGN